MFDSGVVLIDDPRRRIHRLSRKLQDIFDDKERIEKQIEFARSEANNSVGAGTQSKLAFGRTIFKTDSSPQRETSFFDPQAGLLRDFKVAGTFIQNKWVNLDRSEELIQGQEFLVSKTQKVSQGRLKEIAKTLITYEQKKSNSQSRFKSKENLFPGAHFVGRNQ